GREPSGRVVITASYRSAGRVCGLIPYLDHWQLRWRAQKAQVFGCDGIAHAHRNTLRPRSVDRPSVRELEQKLPHLCIVALSWRLEPEHGGLLRVRRLDQHPRTEISHAVDI